MKQAEREYAASALELEPVQYPEINAAIGTPESALPEEQNNFAPASPAPKESRSALSDPQELDLRGLTAPIPLLRTARVVKALGAGESVRIALDDQGSLRDLEDFCKLQGNRIFNRVDDDSGLHLTLTRK
jgi:tRNA 2-thiouridine synthesizing protein A